MILDGHDSHKLYEFITFCEEHGIILLCLPPSYRKLEGIILTRRPSSRSTSIFDLTSSIHVLFEAHGRRLVLHLLIKRVFCRVFRITNGRRPYLPSSSIALKMKRSTTLEIVVLFYLRQITRSDVISTMPPSPRLVRHAVVSSN